ncbi:MAG: hypothetical protein AAF242_13745 [Bacteroidota bacterium]
MTNKEKFWSRFFIGFAVVATLCGIYMITQGDYFIGIAGTITGLFLIYLQNVKPIEKQDENQNSI